MRRYLLLSAAVAIAALAFPSIASAQSGHFLTGGGKAPTCMKIGSGDTTRLQCTATVAGLGGTTFRLEVDADATVQADCRNPGGNIAPGQRTTVDAGGQTGDQPTPRNGRATVSVLTDPLGPLPSTPTCPNNSWTPIITSVTFSNVTLTLFENGTASDTFTVPGTF